MKHGLNKDTRNIQNYDEFKNMMIFLSATAARVEQFVLHIAYNFSLSSGGESIATLHHDCHQIFSEIATSQVESLNCMWQ